MVVDIILGIFLGIGIIAGYRKGLLIEIITLLAFVIAIVSAFKLLKSGIELMTPYVSSGSLAILLSFIIVFSAVFLLIFLLGKILKKIINYSMLGTIDSFAGSLVGGLKAAFAVSMLLWLLHSSKLDLHYQEYTRGAVLYPYMLTFGPTFVEWVSHVIPFNDIFPGIQKLLN